MRVLDSRAPSTTAAAHCQALEHFPVLTSARVVCRECFSSRGVDALSHVVLLIDGYLDTCSGPRAVERQCRRGASLRRLTYLASRDTESSWRKAAVFAARGGYVHILRWLSEFPPGRCSWTPYVMDSAAMLGHFSVVQWLHENRSEGCSELAMPSAACNGHLEMLQWLHANRSEGCDPHVIVNAATSGYLEVVQWLHDHYGSVGTGNAIRAAAGNGHLAVVQWLYTEGGNTYRDQAERALQDAEENKHLDVVGWLTMHRIV